MKKALNKALTIGLVVAVPGIGLAWLAKKLFDSRADDAKFREHIRSTYGSGSIYERDHAED